MPHFFTKCLNSEMSKAIQIQIHRSQLEVLVDFLNTVTREDLLINGEQVAEMTMHFINHLAGKLWGRLDARATNKRKFKVTLKRCEIAAIRLAFDTVYFVPSTQSALLRTVVMEIDRS